MYFDLKQCVVVPMLLCTFAMSAQSVAQDELKKEDDFNNSLCKTIGGEQEQKHYYSYGDSQRSHVSVDCETNVFVIEGGLDKRSSLDSLQQSLFFSVLTGKVPAVVIYDTDGKIGKFEHRICAGSEKAGVLFLRLNGTS